MKRKWSNLLSVSLLIGYNSGWYFSKWYQSNHFRLCNLRSAEERNHHEHIRIQEINRKYYVEICAFDFDIRNAKNVKAVKARMMTLISVNISSPYGRSTRFLYLDENKRSVTFLGEIGTKQKCSGFLSITDEKKLLISISTLVLLKSPRRIRCDRNRTCLLMAFSKSFSDSLRHLTTRFSQMQGTNQQKVKPHAVSRRWVCHFFV